jgi:MoaA/NifB/PqqE/SkfB family radical SAM enzyme
MNHTIDKLPILILYPHSRCNCRCVMCDIWKTSETREISVADLERHAADIASLGVRWVIFSGGEPLMHSDLFSLCRLLRPLEIKLTVLSTGLLLARNAAQLVENVDDIVVSLDGPSSVHDRIRRTPGAFAAMSDGVAAIRRISSDFAVAARCVVQKENFRDLAATVTAAREMGLRSISFGGGYDVHCLQPAGAVAHDPSKRDRSERGRAG